MSISRPPLKSFATRAGSGQRSQALVIVLAMVVIVTTLVVVFFGAVRFDLVATGSYGQSLKAEQLGLGSLQVIVGQLQQEMSKDSLPDTGGTLGTNTLYTNIPPADIVPQGVGTNSSMPSLLKISTSGQFFTGTLANGGLTASTISTTTPSLNGRYISLTRWNNAYMGTFPSSTSAPYWVLMTRSGPNNGASAAFGMGMADAVNNPSLANTNYVTGRIAYAVYDEGGLLDINAAGYSTSSGFTPDQIQTLKGTLAGADLSQVGVDPVALTAWRNAATGAIPSSYLNYVTNTASTNGFLQVAPGDRTFLSRQDLIKAAQAETAGLTTSALTNLATFTRESTMPSWGPSTNAPSGGGLYNYASNATTTYNASPFSSTSPNPNRFVPRVRFSTAGTVTSYHSDGSSYQYTVQKGDALLQHRFPLDRLNWIGAAGPANGGTAKNIQDCFGLVWATSADATVTGTAYGVWKYVGPLTSEQSIIETLDQVAAENTPREPNFFELLQAGILAGSLGVAGDTTATGATAAQILASAYQQFPTLQVLRIGANIINQYNTDCYPRTLEYSQSGQPWQACGVANLPYINLSKAINGADETSNLKGATFVLFNLWNPNQSPTATARPRVRIHAQAATAYISNQWAASHSVFDSTAGAWGFKFSFNTNAELSSSAINGCAVPTLLMGTHLATDPGVQPVPTANAIWSDTPASAFLPEQSGQYVGLRFPAFITDSSYVSSPGPPPVYKTTLNSSTIASDWPTNPNTPNFSWFYTTIQSSQYTLEYFEPTSGLWIPYSYSSGINNNSTWSGNNISSQNAALTFNPDGNYYDPPVFSPLETTFSASTMQMTVDPRSMRFVPYKYNRNNKQTHALIGPLWDANATPTTPYNYQPYGYGGGEAPPNSTTGPKPWEGVPPTLFTNFYHPALLSRNNTSNVWPTSSYADLDGIQRIADSGLFTNLSTTTTPSIGNPYQRSSDQPVFLNRPFNSVAELGYVSRDDPWKSIDFFSANSADSGLLDLFCAHEEPTVTTPGKAIQAGRINLNTRNPAVLAAMLSGTLSDIIGKASISSTTAQAIAKDIVQVTSTTPLTSKDQLVTKFAPAVVMSATPTITDPLQASDFQATSTGSAQDEQNIKVRREAYVRALADVGQTRTWNLMIDLIAQSGKYPPGAKDLSQFVVEGERRYWLHIAIDRLTGQIIAQQLEPVSE